METKYCSKITMVYCLFVLLLFLILVADYRIYKFWTSFGLLNFWQNLINV